MSYKFLLFDLDHTLLDFAADEAAALTQLLEEAGVEDIDSYKSYYVPMNKALWDDLTAGRITKPELIRTRFAKLFEHFGQSVDGAFMAERYQHFLSQQGHVFEGARELLEDLRNQGYRLFAATNGVTFIQKGRLSQSGMGNYFEQIFISDEVGYHKPNKDFYDHISQVVDNFEIHQALMIGDSLSADIQGGINAGMDTAWFNPHHLSNQTMLKPTYIVHNYQEILNILSEK